MTKLIDAFRNFANTPNKCCVRYIYNPQQFHINEIYIICMRLYIYIYSIYVCVCVCLRLWSPTL